MRLIRELERRLESVLDGMAGRMFRGPLHPAELGGSIIRYLDLELDKDLVAPNDFDLFLSPVDLAGQAAPAALTDELARLVEETATDRGWRLDGPAVIRISTDPSVSSGSVRTRASVVRGSRPAWGLLVTDEIHPITVNRAIVGRSASADVILSDDRVSRRHAMIWRESGRVMVDDLASGNGTWVDGAPVRTTPVELRQGDVVTFGPISCRFKFTDS